MAIIKYHNVGITAMSACVPSKVVSNRDFAGNLCNQPAFVWKNYTKRWNYRRSECYADEDDDVRYADFVLLPVLQCSVWTFALLDSQQLDSAWTAVVH